MLQPWLADMGGATQYSLLQHRQRPPIRSLSDIGEMHNALMLLVPDEETRTYHSERTLAEVARGHDVGLVFEPALADGSLVVERMGSGSFMIESHGRAAHVGRAFTDGRSAVVALAKAIVEVSALADPDRGRIVNIGPMHGGGVTNAVAAIAAAIIGSIASWGLIEGFLKSDFELDFMLVLLTTMIGAATTAMLGLAGAVRTLGRKPAPLLREV